MSRTSGVAVGEPAQPREWFTVLYGSRCLRGEKLFITKFTDMVKEICLDEGLLLTDRPYVSLIEEDDNLEYLLSDIRQTINGITEKHFEGIHMPLVLVVDDQTLYELHDEYLVPEFANSSFVYTMKAPKLKEFLVMENWDQVRNDIKELKPLMEEYNPLGPLPPELRPRVRPPSHHSEEIRPRPSSRNDDYRNQRRPQQQPASRPDDRYRDEYRSRPDDRYRTARHEEPEDRYRAPRYEEPVRREPEDRHRTPRHEEPVRREPEDRYRSPRLEEPVRREPEDRYREPEDRHRTPRHEEPVRREPVAVAKPPMTMQVVETALNLITVNTQLLDGLAEDMDSNIEFTNITLPTRPKDLTAMLKLFVLSAENTPPNQSEREREAGTKLRKKITETMLKSRLLKEVRDEFVGGLRVLVADGVMVETEMRQAAEAIILLLRAFAQLVKHNIIDNEEALNLWGEIESPVFSLPGRFYRALTEETVDRMCEVAHKVTKVAASLYMDSIRRELGKDPPEKERRANQPSRASGHSSGRDERDERRRRRDDLGAEEATSSYRYDPYDVDGDEDDESDTSECYGTGQDGYDSRRNAREQDYEAGDQEMYGASREQQRREARRREEHEREREERRRRQEEEREAEIERRHLAEEREAEQRRQFERVQHAVAIHKLEKNRWEQTNDAQIAWLDTNEKEPEVSYRLLANRPVYSDLYQPKAPFVRKANLDGAYRDNEHYLDVMFRLMREDMVSPLRDGIYEQKMQTDPGKLIASSNELKVYPTIEVGALQVRGIDGFPMRVVTIPSSMLRQIREDRQLKFGQCVVISSDKFTKEFHIGWICDRFQEPMQPWQGRLAISFFDEECFDYDQIDKNATYALAESPAYLEAYRHVLRVIKKMRKHVVFPLERYLVHMKKNTRLPQYMRAKEKDEDKEEDKERSLMYAKKLAEARRKEFEERKKKEGRKSPKSDDSSETEDEHVTTEEGGSKEDVIDSDGFNTDEEDQFLTGGRHIHPNPKDLETITIGGHSYNVDKLKDEYKSDTLDETQRKAMCYALTSELAIIQGPPGTGKTHIGVEIVMTILENRTKWRMTEPILIVTFSNQALDHFLDKIRQKIIERGMESIDAPSVVRLGSRSEHDGIKLNCLLATVMKDYEEDLAGEAGNERNKQRKNKQAWLLKLMRAVKTVQYSRTSILQYNLLRQVMDPNHEMQLRQAAHGMCDSSGNPMNMDEVLVSWLLNKSYEKKRDLPPGSDDDEEEMWGGGVPLHGAVRLKPEGRKKKDGKETKKEKNERKRWERRQGRGRGGGGGGESSDDSDNEGEGSSPQEIDQAALAGMVTPTEDDIFESEDAERREDEARLAEALRQLNLERANVDSSRAHHELWMRMEKYEMNQDWEVEREYAAKNNNRLLVDDVEIFSRTTKNSGQRTGKGDNKQVNVDASIVRDANEQKEYILAKEPLDASEVREIRDVRTLPKELRWRLLVHWQTKLATAERLSLDDLCKKHKAACQVFEDASDVARAAVIRRALVVGATTTGSAKRRPLLARIAPKVLVVEEAAEVLEAHLLASIVPSVQHAIFIGDHQQLRPSTAVHQLAKMANMEVSLFERLVKNNYPFHTLGLQHRMLAPLTKHVVKPFFYKMLQDAPSILEYPDVQGMATNLFFWAHNIAEDTLPDSNSKRNRTEAEMCRNLANYLCLQGQYKPKEITIIGMYASQVLEIRDQCARSRGPVADVGVETVDSFQGKENRIMILSLVRSHSGGVGFLAIANRITVALTRAQHGMYVIGNFEDIANYSDMWHKIVNSLNSANLINYDIPVKCQRHGNTTMIKVNMHFHERTPHGGCLETCAYEMDCGHKCKQICHPPHQHEQYCSEGPELECNDPCAKRCPKCDARCTRKCKDGCGTCHNKVTIELDCGHSVRIECGMRNLAKCKEPCTIELECGHICQNKCSEDCVPVGKCEKGVSYLHPICKHYLTLPCNVLRNATGPPPCYEKCPEKLVCGHRCPLNCGEPCPTMCETLVTFTAACGHQLQKQCSQDARHVKCTAKVLSNFPHCSHEIMVECHQSRNQNECRTICKKPTSCGHDCTLSCGECYKRASVHECNALCKNKLPCGHECQGRCGKPCVCKALCRVRCSHLRCGASSRETRGGSVTFGRACSQACVLCVESCDNRCEHRSCSKKCFEACDVAPCNEPCGKTLPCRHACLGLCGEPCPNLCGTCSTVQYRDLIARYPVDDGVKDLLPRLIELPCVSQFANPHIFPYKYMDKAVREQIAAGAIVLRCPDTRCNKIVDDVKRYLKQTKRFWQDADERKWETKLHAEEMSRAEINMKYNEMRSTLAKQQEVASKNYKIKTKGGGRENNRFALETYRMLDSLYVEIRGDMAQMLPAKEYYYWQAVLWCHKTIAGLVCEYMFRMDDMKIDFVSDFQPNLKNVIDEAFERKRSRVYPMRDTFKQLVDVVRDSLEFRRVGQLVPFFRVVAIKAHLHYHMELLNATMRNRQDEKGDVIDLSPTQRDTYKRVIKSILTLPPNDHPQKKLEDLFAKIHTDIYGKLMNDEPVSTTVFKNGLPDF